MAASFAVSEAAAGWWISGYALSVAVGAIVLTAATTRLPRKQVLVGLVALFVVGNLLSAVAPSYSVMLVGRIVAALCHGSFFGIGSLVARFRHETFPVDLADELLAMKMIRLADTEPALRTAWLMACDQAEREMCGIVGGRLERPADDMEVRMHAAAAAAVVRVLDEHIGAAVLAGADLTEFTGATAVARRYAQAIRTATGGAVGDPVANPSQP